MGSGKAFEEGQSFAPFVYFIMLIGVAAMCLPPHHWPIILLPIGAMLLTTNLLYERTEVSGDGVRVQFGFVFPLYVRSIRLDDIDTVVAVTYRPIAEYGGWGIRGMGGRVALNARGDRGVLLTLRRGGTVLVGSQRPEELATAINEVRAVS